MNFTAIIAILELKGILTREEGEKIIEFLNNKPQSTLLADAVNQVDELVDKELPQLLAKLKPAIEKTTQTAAKKVAEKAVDEAGKVAERAVETAKTEAEKIASETAKDVAHTGDLHEVPNTPKPPVKSVASSNSKK